MSGSPFDPYSERPGEGNLGDDPESSRFYGPTEDVSPVPVDEDPYAPPLTRADESKPVDQRPSSVAIVAWIVISLITGLIFYGQSTRERETQRDGTASQFTLRMLEIQGKYMVAASSSLGANREQFYDQAKTLNQGPIDVRLRFVVLAGELSGAEEALSQLDELERLIAQHGKKPTAQQRKVIALLQSLYADYIESEWDAPSLSGAGRDELQDSLGWFGLLALGPRRGEDDASSQSPEREQAMKAAQRVFVVVLLCFMMFLALGAAGLAGAVLLAVFAWMGKLRSHLDAGSRFGGVYVEAFALWMLLFVGLSYGVRYLPFDFDGLLMSGIVSLTTLIALAWPILRGVPGRQLLREVGLTVPGRPAWLEPFWGVVCYVCTLPVLAVGILVTLALMSAFAAVGGGAVDEFSMPNSPSHPIFESIGEAAWLVWLKLFFVAAVAAPIVEEIMFRGLLYRHLRDATARKRVLISVLISGGVSSFVFAVIHPQGIFGVPVLMSLAFAFCLAREWRGSIVAPMTMHAINNGSVTLLFMILLSI